MNDLVEMTSNLNSSPVAAKYSKTAGAQTYFNWTSNQAGMGTCSNVNCHFEAVTPAWGATPFASPADCSQCHGAPPSGGGSGAAGSHGKHDAYYAGAAQCKKCHTNHTVEAAPFAHATSAGQRNIKVVLHDPADLSSGSYSGTGANFLPSQTPTFGDCSTTYCHSDGKGNYSTPTWNIPASGACGTCHGAKDTAPPSPASPHATHVGTAEGYLYSCSRCHSRTTEPTANSTTFALISSVHMHVNKSIDVAFDSVNPAGNWNGTTCSATYCHSNANPYGGSNTPVTQAWSGSLDCGGCHSKATDGSPTWSAPHTKHIKTYGANTNFTCNSCHAATVSDNTTLSDKSKHVDGTKTVSFNAFANSAATPNLAAHQCSNVYCHGDGTTATPTVTVTWSGTLDCNGCHGGSAADAPTSAPHAKHVASSSPYRYSCAKCHARTAKDTTDATTFATISSYSFHVNKTPDVAFNTFVGAGSWNDGTNTCSTTYCHSTGNTNVNPANLPGAYGGSVYAAPTWSGTVGCNGCHGRSTASSGMPDYTNAGTPGSATSNSHTKHVVGSSLACVECHEKTTKNGTTIRSTTPGYHVNKTASDVFFNLSGLSKLGTYNSTDKTCSATYCHGTGPSVAWGGSTTCATCHDATNSGGLGGRHDKHYNSATIFWNMTGNDKYTGGVYAYACKNCHPTNTHATGPAGANNDANIATTGVSRITAYTPGGTSSTDGRGYKYSNGGTCTTSCHTDGQGGGPATSVTWTTAPAAGCGTCHHKAGDAGPDWSNAHTKHINTYSTNANLTCNACHAGTASNNTTINGASGAAQHPNGVKNIQFNAWVNSAATYPDTATGCSNTYCHSQGTTLTGTPTHSAVKWNDTITCGSCHSGGIATGPDYATGPSKGNSHAKHVAAGYSCDDCHFTTTNNGTSITTPANHVNKVYNVVQGTGITFTYTFAEPGGTCSTISCHGDNNATWGGTVNCQDCHKGASDNDVWPPFTTASPVAHLETAKWTSTGHGAAGAYTSGNNGANFGVETKECEFCHDPGVGHNNAANLFRLKNYSTVDWGRNGPCMICHAVGSTGVTVGSTTKNGTTKVGAYHFGSHHGSANGGGQFCWDCHDGHGDGNAYMVHTEVAKVSNRTTGAPTTSVATTFTLSSPPVWGDYVKDTTFNGICQSCHSTAASPNKVDHFRSDLYDANHNPGTRCTVCHSHNTNKADAFKPGGNCDLCHGYPPIRRGLAAGTVMAHNNYSSAKFEDYSGGGGAHTIGKHISATARASEGWANCSVCHNSEEAYHTMQTPVKPSTITVDVHDGQKFDYQRTLGPERYTGTLTDKAGSAHTNTTGSCSNTNCHFKPSKKWSNER